MHTFRSGLKTAVLCLFTIAAVQGWAAPTEGQSTPQQACSILVARSVTPDLGGPALDTARIQSALDQCSPNQAVVLRVNGKQNAFLSAPLVIPRGVALFLDGGTVLYASRNPRDYDLAPMSCGGQAKEIPACKPFLFSYQAPFSGIDGSGVIDGQGGEPLQGLNGKSWWQLEAEASANSKTISSPDLVSSYESQSFFLNGVTLRNAAGAHAAIFKTIGFRSSGVKIDAPQAPSNITGLLLSNALAGAVENAWIRVPGESLILKPSILGSTAQTRIRDLHIYGGKGILLGDQQYGDTKNLDFQNVTVKGSEAGIVLDLRGHERGKMQNLHLQDLCMQDVPSPIKKIGDFDGGKQAVLFAHAIVQGKGELTEEGVKQDSNATCGPIPEYAAAPSSSDHPEFLMPKRPGTRTHLRVAADGSADFRTVQEALDALPPTGGDVAVMPGIYREVVTIRKPHVRLHGTNDDLTKTVLVFNNGPKNGGTFASATVFVEADDVTVDHLTIQNDLGQKGQAVALAALGDRGVFRYLRILGAQDTLFSTAKLCYGDYGPCVPARQLFMDDYIAGGVDFIFGDSKAVLEHCELHGIDNSNVMYTAQSKHYPEEESGYVISHSKLTADTGARAIALGRAWRPYSTVVYLNTEMDAPVTPAGWVEWRRFGKSTLETAYYAEYNSTGSGADPSAREPHSHQLTENEAKQWDPRKFLQGKDGWNPLIEARQR